MQEFRFGWTVSRMPETADDLRNAAAPCGPAHAVAALVLPFMATTRYTVVNPME
jgi:hypothetical protein